MPQFLTRPDRPALAYEKHDGAGPTIVFFPGYASDMAGGKALALDGWADATDHGLLRFDYAGCGQSEGVFGAETLASWRDDALDCIDQLTEGPLILVGSSMGGWLMLLAALARPERVVGLVGIAAAPDFTDWGFDDTLRQTLLEDGLIARPSDYSDAPTITTLEFWRSGQANLLLDGKIAFDGPVRLLHGMLDPDVPPSITFRLGRALRSDDVQTILIKDGDHRLSRPGDLDLLIATVARLVKSQ
ncbi:pimeloyl-ACP methyl ester carboxylesterase [Sphingomonas vulcanisoli]|uniref:Pimeloyl-ACP methyl ester carboxylesterase n=1 Tax=Sphingomonas vulcanisoli TaxID=1658060 RepID=A0ABX0TPN0_9SPHN|nr:alpha/beta hydrolase [Sphingomonas vulcanisoli]NIJ07479.1 pimeloyl-ACP methyl ester carboxylesterase [Sphingomonas vulcanisoli]